jgi:hypothetical protein
MHAATINTERLLDHRAESPRFAMASLIFACILVFVGAVSVYDGYLVIRTGSDIRYFEKNPIGLCLIEYNHGNPDLFLAVKGAGTTIALAVMVALYRRSQRLALPVAYALLLFQTGLLIFLERS